MVYKCNPAFSVFDPFSFKDCGILGNPSNGDVSAPEGTTFDNKAVYSCDEGYILNGRETRLCLSTGLWSSTAPTCVKGIVLFIAFIYNSYSRKYKLF
jgi:hypothetical protein